MIAGTKIPANLSELLHNNPTNINIPLAHPAQSLPTDPVVYMDITINGMPRGRITIELYSHIVPLTAENFRQLCVGHVDKLTGRLLGYKDCSFHRVIKDFMVQGGDILNNNGTGVTSIYNGKPFNDENFTVKHDKAGLLSMANAGPNSNGSQFFITLNACQHLDGKHVVFGQVIDGMQTVRKIEAVTTGDQDKPTLPVVISDCGEL